MNCKVSEEYIMRYFDGNLNDIEVGQLKQHIKSCEKCSFDFESLSEIFENLNNDSIIEPPEDFEEQVMLKVNVLEAERKKKSGRFIAFIYSFAALILVALFAFLIADLRGMDTSNTAFNFTGSISSASEFFSAAAGMVETVFDVLVSVIGTFLHIVFVVVKTYYYVIIMLAAILFAVEWMFVSLVRRENGGMAK